MSRVLCQALGTSLLLASAGCDIPETRLGPGTHDLLVQAILDGGTGLHLISIEWSDGTPRSPAFRAVVTLRTPDGRDLTATPISGPGPAETYSVTEGLAKGKEYSLRVVDGSRIVSGKTTVPDAVPVSAALAMMAFSRSKDTLRLSWPRVPGAKAYHIAIQTMAPGSGGVGGTYYSTFADTSLVLPGSLRTFENDDVFEFNAEGGETRVVVSAVDENFYVYYRAQIDPFAGAPPSRLNGAIGVFGSMVPILVRRLAVTQ